MPINLGLAQREQTVRHLKFEKISFLYMINLRKRNYPMPEGMDHG